MKFSNVMKKACAAVVAGVMAVAGVGVLPVDIDVEGIFAGYTLLDDVTIVEVGTSNTVDIDVDSISYEYNEQYKELHMFMNFNVSSTDYLDYPNSFYNTICVYRTKSYDGITYSAITDSFKSIGECPKGNEKFPQFGVGLLNKNSTNNFPYYCYEIGYIPPDENGNSNTSDEDFVCLKKLYITYDEISKHFFTLSESSGTNSENICYNYILTKASYTTDDMIVTYKNLVSEYQKITLGNNTSTDFTITCDVAENEDKVKEYQLYKGTQLIASSGSGSNVISSTSSALPVGTDYYINVVATDGSSLKTKINLEVEKHSGFSSTELSIGGTSLFSMKIDDSIPYIGGSTVNFSTLKFPVNFTIKDDGTVRFGINIEKDILDDDAKFYDFDTEWKSFQRKYKKTSLYAGTSLKSLKKFMEQPSQKTKLLSASEALDFEFIGYGEGKLNDDGTVTIKAEVCGSLTGSMNISRQYFVGIIPVVVEAKGSGGAKVSGNVNCILLDNKSQLNGDLGLGFNISLTPYIGVGIKGVLSAGVTGNATLSLDFILMSTTQKPGLDEAKLDASLGIKLYCLFYTHTFNITRGTWNIYNRASTTNYESAPIEDTINLYDSSQYTLSDREYEAIFTETLPTYNAAASNTLISDIFLSAEPKIVNSGSDKVMVFLSTDDTRSAVNSTVLMYTVYDSETMTWSEPAQVDSNETMDWAPYLYEFDGKIYVVYADANQTFSDDATIDDMAASLNIAAAEFVDGKFVAASVTSNEIYDSRPTVTVIDGVPTAVWVSNTDSDFFGQNSTNNVQYSQLIDGVWSSPVTAAENLNCVTSVSAGTMSGTGYIAVTTDGDNDLSTTGDSVLTVYDFGGTAAEIAEGTAENPVFGTIPSVEGDVLVWYEDGNLAYRTSAEAETAYVFESAAVTSDYTIAGNKIMFVSTDSEGNSGIYTISYENGAWGSAVEAAEVTDSVTSYSATDDMVVFVDTHMEITDESITDTSALKYCLYNEKYDIEVHYADFDYEAITPSENLDVAIGITNGTQNALTSVNVEIAKADGTKTTQTVECSLASGETGEITAQFTVPATIDDTAYTVTVTGAEADTNAENNSTSFNLGLTELSVTARETVVNNNSYFIAEIKNESYIETSGTVTISDTDGTVLYTETLDSIPANDTANVIVKADELFGEDETETSKVVIVSVVSDKEEYYDSNNSVSEYAAIMDNRVPYVTVVFMDSEKNEISREVYDVGVTVTPPELPENAIGWVVYGDETETIVTDFSNIQKDVVYVAKAEEKLEVTAEAGENSVTLNWNEISTADSYKVMSYTDGEFEDIAETTETTYTVEALEAHKEYSFAVSFSSNGEWSECTEEDVVTVEVTEGLGFTAQPTDFTGKIGATATFTVEASGENITYQWEQDTGNGWTAIKTTAGRKSSFSIGITEARLKYKYRCVISDGTNSFTSNEVKMTAEEVFEITAQPTDFTGKIGDTATFTVEATGENLTYQWEQDTGNGWTAINTTAGRKSSFSIGVTATRLKYKYRCVVSDGTNSITSDEVKMVVNEEFEITTQPTDFTGKIGDTATFTVEATGENLTYQWEQDTGSGWTAINTTAGRKSSFSIGVTSARLKYKYRCVISNGTNNITSDEVKMVVAGEFEITTQPTDFTGKIGDTAKFTVEVTGENLTYQWEQDTGSGWTAINTTAGRKASFSIGVTAARLKYKYRCVISNGTNSITSDEVKMVVAGEFEITTQPTDFTGKIGDTAKFTVEATGENLTYQWEQDTGNGWTAINTTAGRKSSFSIDVTAARLNYKYRCVVSNGTTSITSDEVKMVIDEDLAITSQPSNYIGAIGSTAKFTVGATGATSYQWYQNTGNGWTAINTTAGRSNTFSVAVAEFRLGYLYRCVVSDGTNEITSDEVQMYIG